MTAEIVAGLVTDYDLAGRQRALARGSTEHVRFSVATGVAVYFCDPNSPWQRGSNENTNGLLRQYLPRTTNMQTLTQDDLDTIAAELNGRPRQTLAYQTPSEALAEAGPSVLLTSATRGGRGNRFRRPQPSPARRPSSPPRGSTSGGRTTPATDPRHRGWPLPGSPGSSTGT